MKDGALVVVVAPLVGVLVLLLVLERRGEESAAPRPATLTERVEKTGELAAMAVTASGRGAAGEPMVELPPTVEGDHVVMSTPTLPHVAVSIGLPEWLDRSAFADALAMVTPQGLFERTADWWNQDEFLALTGDELAQLVPDSGYPFAGDKTLLDFVGGLPTLEDCERGFADERVQAALSRAAAFEIPLNSLGMTPKAERSPEWQRDFDELVAAYRVRELDLARELERVTGFAHWTILQREFAAWSR